MAKATNDVFDDWARRGRAEGMEKGHFVRAIQALERIPIQPKDRCLDLGCGNGWAARWLAARSGGDAVGVDAAPTMVATAREQPFAGVTYTQAPFESLPFPDHTFRHGFSMEALYYADDLPQALNEIHRVIEPGGTLTVCTDFFVENPYCHDWPDKMNIPMSLLSAEDWIAALAQAGFSNMVAFRCLDSRPIDPALIGAEREAVRHFREEIGALAILCEA